MTTQQAARPGERGAPARGAGAPLVFQARDYHTGTAAQRTQRRRLGWVVGAVLVAVLAVSLAMVLASLVTAPGQPFQWQVLASRSATAWQRMDSQRLVFHALQLLLLLSIVLGLALHRKRARLVLDDQSLRYTSGLPVVWRWLDWQLDLQALRSGAVQWKLGGAPVPANPLSTLRLTWSKGARLGLSPARWYLPGGSSRSPVSSRTAWLAWCCGTLPKICPWCSRCSKTFPWYARCASAACRCRVQTANHPARSGART